MQLTLSNFVEGDLDVLLRYLGIFASTEVTIRSATTADPAGDK
jgi:hypothetical protein